MFSMSRGAVILTSVLFVASFFAQLIVEGFMLSFVVLYPRIASHFEVTTGEMNAISSVCFSLWFFVGPIAGVLSQRLGARKTVVASALFSAVGFICSAYADSIWTLLLSFGVIVGGSLGISYVPAVTVIGIQVKDPFWCHVMTTAVSVGGAVGGIMFPEFFEWLLSVCHWQEVLLILAGIGLQLVVCGVIFGLVDTIKLPDPKKFFLANNIALSAMKLLEQIDMMMPMARPRQASIYEPALLQHSFNNEGNLSASLRRKRLLQPRSFSVADHRLPKLRLSDINQDSVILNPHGTDLSQSLDARQLTMYRNQVVAAHRRRLSTIESISKTHFTDQSADERPKTARNEGKSCDQKQSLRDVIVAEEPASPTFLTKVEYFLRKTPRTGPGSVESTARSYYQAVNANKVVASPRILPPKTIPVINANLVESDRSDEVEMSELSIMRDLQDSVPSSTSPRCLGLPVIPDEDQSQITVLPEKASVTSTWGAIDTFMLSLFYLSTFLWNVGYFAWFSALPFQLDRRGLKGSDISRVFSLPAFFIAIGRIGAAAFVASPLNNDKCLFYTCVTMMSGIALIPFCLPVFSYKLVIASCCAYDLFFGAQTAILPNVLIDLAPLETLNVQFGFLLFVSGAGGALGPPLSGFMIDACDCFNGAFILSTCLIFAAALVMLPLHFPPFNKQFLLRE